MYDWDVVIAGAGPAGLAAGMVFADSGLRTLVCEKKRLPLDKACGEGVMPPGAAVLQRLGIYELLPPGGFAPFQGIRFYSPAGRCASGVFREGPGLGIDRRILSKALAQRARSTAGLTMWEEAPVEGFDRESGSLRVQVKGETLSTRLLVGADGLHSRLRRLSGVHMACRRHNRWGIRQHFHVRPWSDFVEVYWAQGAEAYITPCGAEMVNVAFLWDADRQDGRAAGRSLFDSLMDKFPELRSRLDGAEPAGPPAAAGPLEQRAKSPIGDGVLLIGDAAGYLDALTGEGISIALAQALALQDTVVPLLCRQDGMLIAAELAGYLQVHRKIVRPYYLITGKVLALSRHPRMVEGAISLLSRFPGLFQRLLSMNMGPGW